MKTSRLGRRGFFGALSACFAWMLPLKRATAEAPVEQKILAGDPSYWSKNTVFGWESDTAPGVKNAVVMGHGSFAKKSNVVILGNEKTESLIVGSWEFSADEIGPYFVKSVTGEKYRLVRENVCNVNPNVGWGQKALDAIEPLDKSGPRIKLR